MSWRSTATIRIAGVTKRDLSIPVSRTLQAVLGKLDRQGHKPLVVGGAVRDALLGEDPKDIDVEVHGTHYEDLTKTLSQHGRVSLVGKAFGVVKFTDPDGHDYDFSIPRRENKAGVGHRDFETTFDPDITPEEAAARRDFTFNALAYDPVNRELHDYFGGEQDLKDKVIRHTSEAFSEDPLRVLRGMQFAARYGMDVHPDTAELSKSIAHEYPTIPKERVGEEFMKLATKGREPGRAIDYLQKTGWHENFPEIRNLNGVPQDSVWHPEGDVAAHTAHAMNAAAKVADREGLEGDDRATVVFGAMAHDFGKPTHTQAGGDRITSFGHDAAGGPIARQFLEGIGIKPDITNKVVPLVENHMQHLNYEKNLSSRTVRRLAQRLHPASIKELSYVMESDHSGRPPLPGGMPPGAQKMLDKAAESHVTEEPMARLIEGRDVMPYYNNEPGPHIGEVVKAAYEAQMNGEINTPEEGQDWLKKRLSKTAHEEEYVGEDYHHNDELHKEDHEHVDMGVQELVGKLAYPMHTRQECDRAKTMYPDDPEHYSVDDWDYWSSAARSGIDTPIEVGRQSDGFWVVRNGHHRLAWAQEQGLKTIPAILYDSPYGDERTAEKEGSWRDVRNKGVRLRNSHKVNIVLLDDEVVAADVDGDHGTYHVVLYRQDPESWAISMWECSCKWGDWAFRRQHTYVGRMCSHALATLYEVHGTEYRRTAARDITLPDDVVKAFTATGEQQRGEPERIGQSLYSLGGGVLPFVAEHVGDLTHRMTHHVGYGTTYPNLVSEKVEKTLRPLTNPYGFERELNENLESNASYYGRNVDEMRSQQDEILRNYADAHRQLKVYNGPQWDARQAAILIGEKQWKRATLMLKHLRGLLEDPEEFHRQAMSFERNEDGSLREYEPEYEPEQPTRTAHIPEGWDWYYKGDDPDETKGFKEPHDTLYHVAPSGLREAIQQVGLEGSRTVYGEGLYAWDSPEGAEGWRKQVEQFYKPDIHGHGEMDVWKVDAKDLPIHGDEAWPDVDPDEAPNPSSHFIPGKVGPERLTLHSRVSMAVPPEYWQDQGDLYHITDKQNVSGILHRGLVPHGGYSEWNPDEGDMAERLETRRNHLYFHTEPPTQYEKDSIWRAHVVVDPKMLDPQKVKADEDWAEHVHEKVRADPEFEESPFAHDPPPTEERWQESLEWHGTTPEGLGEWADRVGLGDNPEHTMRSVEETHTVAHEGPVPKGAIKGFYAKEPTGESESYKEELRWHPNEAYEGKDEMNHWAEGFPEASECPHGDECELRDVVPKVAAFVDHDPHDILDEKSLRKHLVRKHNDDPQFEGVIHLMEPDEMDELHSEDHSQFMGDNWGKDWDEDRDFLEGWHQPYKKKTAEDYVRDIEPASKREGDDFDYDTRWFHDKLNTDVLDTVKNLSDAYPVTKSWFKGIRVSDYGPVPCVVSNDKKIWLPPSYLDKPSANLPPRKGVNSLIAHEFGHVLQASVLKDSVGEHAIPDRDIHDLLTGNYSDDDLAHPDCPATYLMEHAKKKWPDERISGYAETNQRERFAEAMRKHWVEPRERLDKHSEFIGANIDFLYHRNGSGWKSRQEKTASSWFGKLMVDPHEVVASTSRGTLLIYATSGRTVKLSVEIASDSQSIRQGLMNRYVLPKDEGMVFLYPMPPSHSGFWMKNTLIPLSVAFWDQMGRIIEVKDMEPCVPGRDCPVYRCSKPYWGAVEVNKGLFRQYGVRPGDRIELRK